MNKNGLTKVEKGDASRTRKSIKRMKRGSTISFISTAEGFSGEGILTPAGKVNLKLLMNI